MPVGTVRDWPDLAQRGVMVDVSRDKVPTMETLRDLIDWLEGLDDVQDVYHNAEMQ